MLFSDSPFLQGFLQQCKFTGQGSAKGDWRFPRGRGGVQKGQPAVKTGSAGAEVIQPVASRGVLGLCLSFFCIMGVCSSLELGEVTLGKCLEQ
jgi:hypothetical protein